MEEFFHMKATGIVRRIDDLGRVVVPKEIRRTLRIREGDPLEIFTDKEGEIILKKYSPMGELGGVVKELCQAVAKASQRSVAICDRDSVIAVAGASAKSLSEVSISSDLKHLMEERNRYDGKEQKHRYYVSEDKTGEIALAYPIISSGDVTGCIIFLEDGEKKGVSEVDIKLADMLTLFLGSQLEN